MPINEGNQVVSIIYYAPGNSPIVNKRHKGVRQIGIYSGGYLSKVDDSHVNLSPLICEITDGTHQVRVETTETIEGKVVSSANPYVILRWNYTGSSNDYMEILATNSPEANDLIVGKCSFDGDGNLQGFSYSERSTPNMMNLFLRIEAPDALMTNKMKVIVRAGRISTSSGVVSISDTETPSPFTHSGGGSMEYGLVYIDSSGNVQIVNASGNTTVPSFAGKMVLAIVAIIAATTTITQSMITDTRSFLSKPIDVDNSTIEFDSVTGKLKIKSIGSSQIDSIFGPRTDKDSLGNSLVKDGIYLATGDGDIFAYGVLSSTSNITVKSGSAKPPTIPVGTAPGNSGWTVGTFGKIRKGEYVKVEIVGTITIIYWVPTGTGSLVKQ